MNAHLGQQCINHTVLYKQGLPQDCNRNTGTKDGRDIVNRPENPNPLNLHVQYQSNTEGKDYLGRHRYEHILKGNLDRLVKHIVLKHFPVIVQGNEGWLVQQVIIRK